MRTSAAPGPARDDVPDGERECDEREPRDVVGACHQDDEARAAEHHAGAKPMMRSVATAMVRGARLAQERVRTSRTVS